MNREQKKHELGSDQCHQDQGRNDLGDFDGCMDGLMNSGDFIDCHCQEPDRHQPPPACLVFVRLLDRDHRQKTGVEQKDTGQAAYYTFNAR